LIAPEISAKIDWDDLDRGLSAGPPVLASGSTRRGVGGWRQRAVDSLGVNLEFLREETSYGNLRP
jgi:hypothetical protein